ncbi:MAG: hypothetical protein EA362_04095 [Saprospirales bacterium]|nr:MAG: hypothetical protein EA362_04095 [Saprospirales bacterium]
MIYRILKIWVKAGYSHYFSNIEVVGLENVDREKPAIFAVNHPSAFIEPTLIATESPFDVHFITRGDVFVKQFRWFFDATNQVPVFRFKDGFSSLRNNKSSFDKCHEKLMSGAKLLIFCEGSMKWVKRLRPVQQGAAKLAMGTLEKDPELPLMIHPVGVNYEDHTKAGTDIMLQIGKAIPMAEYFAKYQKSPREVIKGLTHDLQAALQECIVHIERDEDLLLMDQIWGPLSDVSQVENKKYNGILFSKYKKAANWINGMNLDKKSELKIKAADYSKSLSWFNLSDRQLKALTVFSWWDYLWLLSLGSILKIVFELNKLPYRLADFISEKKTPNVEFYVSVKAVLTALFYTLFILFLLVFWSPFWHVLIFVTLAKIAFYTDDRWNAMIKGLFVNKNKLREAGFRRKDLVQFLKENISDEKA